MKLYGLTVALTALAVAGCGQNKNGSSSENQLIQVPTAQIRTPNLRETSSLMMVDSGKSIKVGDEIMEAELLFPRPERRAVAFRDLPPGFGPDYQSKGWETDAEGFGIISLGGKVVVAVRSELGVDDARLRQVLRKYQIALDARFTPDLKFESPNLQISWARYWFVEDPPHRLMICAVRPKANVLNITEALGYDEAMDAMRMGKSQARHDLQKASGSGE